MRYLAYDTETTGLSKHCNVLTAYFIVLDENLKEIAKLDLKIKHEKYNIYAKAMEINKIDLVQHEKIATTVDESKEILEKFLIENRSSNGMSYTSGEAKLPPSYKQIGHNLIFDINMILNNKLICREFYNENMTEEYIDTYSLCRIYRSEKLITCKSLTLENICKYFEIEINSNNLHTAEYDIKMTIELYKKLREFRNENFGTKFLKEF